MWRPLVNTEKQKRATTRLFPQNYSFPFAFPSFLVIPTTQIPFHAAIKNKTFLGLSQPRKGSPPRGEKWNRMKRFEKI